MDWMSNLFVVLFLTTITGTVFWVVGMIFRMKWFRKDTRLLRFQMQATQCAFLIPFVYVILYAHTQGEARTTGSMIDQFYSTSAIRKLSAFLGCVWLLLFLGLLAHKIYVRYQWIQVFRGNIPEEDEQTKEMFREICRKLGIEGKISLYRNDSVDMPCVTYAKGFAVVLPLRQYTRKETSVILYHELCHYLNCDIYLKTASCIVELLHVFNPAAHILLRQLNLVCEECCDRLACEKGAEEFNGKEYFLAILSVLMEEGSKERYNLFMLADTIGDYERRVQCMKEYRLHGGFKKGMAALLSGCFLFGSSMTALAVGDGMTEVYDAVADATDSRMESSMDAAPIMDSAAAISEEELIEEFARAYDLEPEDVVIVGEEGIEVIGDFITLDWNIPKGKTYMTTGFTKDAGSKVTITTVGDPSDIKYQSGVKDPNDLMRYVEGSGDMAYSLDIKISGRHCFFVTNLDSSRELNVKGTVIK